MSLGTSVYPKQLISLTTSTLPSSGKRHELMQNPLQPAVLQQTSSS